MGLSIPCYLEESDGTFEAFYHYLLKQKTDPFMSYFSGVIQAQIFPVWFSIAFTGIAKNRS